MDPVMQRGDNVGSGTLKPPHLSIRRMTGPQHINNLK